MHVAHNNSWFNGAKSGFQQLLESVPDATVGVDEDGTIVLANGPAVELFGYRRHELIGASVELLVPESLRTLHARQRTEYLADPGPREMSERLDLSARKRDGTEFPVQIALSSIEIVEKTLVVAAIRDVSRLRAAERKFEQLLEFAPDSIVGADGSGRIILVNRQTERLFGYQREELLGKEIEILVPARYRDRHRGLRADFFEEPTTRPMGAGIELFAVRKDGSEFPAEISLAGIESEQGSIAIAAIRDVSDSVRAAR